MAGIARAERERRDALYAKGLKQCTTCDEPLPLADFAPQSDGYRGLTGSCRPCRNVRTADYQKRNPEKLADRQRRWRDENPRRWLAISRRRDVRARWRRDGVAA
jgi:hypothetical protein